MSVKVCHFTSIHSSGDTRIFVKECSSLVKAGYEVYLIAVNAKEEVVNGVHVINVDAAVKGRLHRMWVTGKLVYEKALSIDAHIYHFHDPELIPFALRLIKKGKKVIYDVHEDIPRQILAKYYIPKPFRKLISLITEAVEDWVAGKFSWIITATPFIRDRFLKFTPRVTEVCNFPLISEWNGALAYHDKPLHLCYIGSITTARGIVEMVKAMDGLPYQLHLCGSFSPPALREEVIILPGWKQVVEHGYSSRAHVMTVLNNSRAGLVTLHPIINYVDAYPVKMFEYMIAGIPVISSDIPLWKGIVDATNCGVCVNPLHPPAIRNAIIEIMENEKLSQQMGLNGRNAVSEKYNWQIEETKLLSIYSELSAQ
ncbi:MAG: glycosyltransferase family 4 protein [Bacteroidetes bacterium]|nr:glycosyltransferase family 4 protein [Bacteroidota bacterium]